jgi:ATP-binding protein involved in chromosome partitioning
VRKSITFCRKVGLRVLGVVENMSGFVCPDCGSRHEIFKSGGGEVMAKEMGVPFLGKIPIDSNVVTACDSGRPFCQNYEKTQTAEAFTEIIEPILNLDVNEKAAA